MIRGWTDLAVTIFLGVAIVLSAGPAAGGTLSPELQEIMHTSSPGDEIAVIIDLANGLDIGALAFPTKAARRAGVVTALRNRAVGAEAPVRRFLADRQVTRVRSLWAIGGLAVQVPVDAIEDLVRLPGVESIRLDGVMNLPATAPNAVAEGGWNLEMIGAPDLWSRGIDGDGVVVAVVDSGVDSNHEDLGPRWRGGVNSWFDPYDEHPTPYDATGHGTQVTGLVLGGDASGTAIGVAPGTRWIAGKNFDDNGLSTFSTTHEIFQWLLDPDDNASTDDAPDIVNNSWGFRDLPGECVEEFADDLQVLRAAGIAVVFSAGNGGPNPATSVSPANNQGAFAVGGSDAVDGVMNSSSRGPSACGGGVFPTLIAPGDGVLTADLTFGGLVPDATTEVLGTSFAAPHVAGAMALLLSAHPQATLDELEQALRAGAEDLGPDGPDDSSGWGRLDVVKAEAELAALVGGPGNAAVYTDEGAYLAALAGQDTISEGFEDETIWGGTRSPSTAAGITSRGISWTSNHLDNDITTGGGPAYTGDWGFYSLPHGDQSLTEPFDFITDGFSGGGAAPMNAVGGWFVGTSGGQLVLILDGDEANPVDLGPVNVVHDFYGVVVDGSFSSFEFRETEGTVEDPKIVFVDDITIRLVGATATPPTGVVAGVANFPGALGSDWHTDLFLHNATAGAISVQLSFSPANSGPGNPVTLSVTPDETLALADVVNTLFGATGSGAIQWRVVSGDAAGLLVSANTYNRVDTIRRYGQQIPGVRWSETAPAGTSVWVPALASRYRTNLGFATDETCSRVTIRGYDQTGLQVAQRVLNVLPMTWVQLNGIFRDVFPNLLDDPDGAALADSVHRFEVVGENGRIVAYTSIIDNQTSDGSYMLGQLPLGGQEFSWLPGAAKINGANNSRWFSDAILMHIGGSNDTTNFGFFGPGANLAGSIDTEGVTLAPDESTIQEDILGSLFGYQPPAVGSLLAISPLSSAGVAWMRTYTVEPVTGGESRTYGQAIGPRSQDSMVTASSEGRIYGFSHDADSRSNLILQNTRSAGGDYLASAVRVRLLGSSGQVLHEEDYALEPGEYRQHNLFVDDYGISQLEAGAALVTILDQAIPGETGGVDAMVSEVNGNTNAGTNDGRLIRAQGPGLP